MNETVNLNIERAFNGYILTGTNTNDCPYKLIIEEKEEADSNLVEFKAMQSLFYQIMEYFGVFNSKHNKYRLEIKVTDQEGNEIDDIGELNE